MKGNQLMALSQKMNHAYAKLCQPILRRFDLARPSFDILMFLGTHPEYSTAQEISEAWCIKKNLISVHVEKLVSAGYLQRSAVEGDRRKIGLRCTEKALPVLEAGSRLQQEFFGRLTQGLTAEEWESCRRLLEVIAVNADAVE